MTNLVDQLPNLRAPLLGLFGNEDSYPSPEQVDELDEILTADGKPHEFHRYDDAGHAFFSVDRPSYRVAAANDGWERIAALLHHPPRRLSMCTYATVKTTLEGSAKGPDSSWFHVTDGTVYFDHPVHAMAEHTLNIDFADPARGPGARVAVELTAASARELVAAIEAALAVGARRADRLSFLTRARERRTWA